MTHKSKSPPDESALTAAEAAAFDTVVEECRRLSQMGVVPLSLDKWTHIGVIVREALQHPAAGPERVQALTAAAQELVASVRAWSPELAQMLVDLFGWEE